MNKNTRHDSLKIILVDSDIQMMSLMEADQCVQQYSISTGKNGMGEVINSEMTPRGWHQIRAKIGHNAPANTVFVERRATGEIFNSLMRSSFPGRDWILTRILWLSGLEVGKNRLGQVDTMRRYIYIHGSPDDVQMGAPGSRGCIRMHNHDIIQLFEWTPASTKVLIR